MGSVCSSSSHHAKQAHVSRSDRASKTSSKRQQRDSLSGAAVEEDDNKSAAGVGDTEDLNTAQIIAEIDDIPEGIVRSSSPRKFERYPYVEILKKLTTRRSVLRKRAYQLLYRLATPPEVSLVLPPPSDTATGPGPLELDGDASGGGGGSGGSATVVSPLEVVVDTLASSDDDVSVQCSPSESSLGGLVEKFIMVGRDPHLNARRERFNRKRHALKAQQASLKAPSKNEDPSDGMSTGDSRCGTATASESGSSYATITRSDSVVRKKTTTASAAAAAILSSARTNDIVDITRDFRAEIDRKKKERIVTFVLVDDREHAAKLQAVSQKLAEKFGALDATSVNCPWMESTDAVPTATPTPRVLQPQHLPGLFKPESITISPSRYGFTEEDTVGNDGNKHGEVKITRSQSGRIVSLTTRRTTVTFPNAPRHSSVTSVAKIVEDNSTTTTTSVSRHSISDIKALQSSGLLSEAEANEMFGKGAALPTFTSSYVESEGDSEEEIAGNALGATGSPKKPSASLATSIRRHDSLERIRRKQDASFISGDGMFRDSKFKDALEMSTALQEQFSNKLGTNGGVESPLTTRSPAQRSLSSSFQSSLHNIPRMFGGPHYGINDSSFSFVSGDAPAHITAAASAYSTTPEKYRLPLRIDTSTNRPPLASIRDDPLHSGSIRSPVSVTTIKDFLANESFGIRTTSSKSMGGMSDAPFMSPALESPPVNADPEALDEWHMIQHEKQNYASLVHQVLGTSSGSAAPSPTKIQSPRLGMDLYSANSAEHDEVSDFIRSTRDAPAGFMGEGGHGWLEEETISVNEEVINELEKMLQNTQLRHTLMHAREDDADGSGGEETHQSAGYDDDGMHQPNHTNGNINSLPIGIDGTTFVYHFSAPPVAFLSEEMERELAQRAERRKRRAVLLRQMAAAQARLKQREIFLTNRLQRTINKNDYSLALALNKFVI